MESQVIRVEPIGDDEVRVHLPSGQVEILTDHQQDVLTAAFDALERN